MHSGQAQAKSRFQLPQEDLRTTQCKSYPTQDHQNEHIVKWAVNGIGFIVVDEDAFSKEILPKYFKHSNYSSFVRQVPTFSFSSTCTISIKYERTTRKATSIIRTLIATMNKIS